MPMPSRKRLLLIAILILLVGLATWFIIARERRCPTHIVLYGNVDVRLVNIGFRVAGTVSSLRYEEGDFVPAGALVSTLDESPYNSQLLESKASHEAIQANLNNAEILLKRRLELIGSGGVSQEDLDNALSTYNQLKASLAQAASAISVSSTTSPTPKPLPPPTASS